MTTNAEQAEIARTTYRYLRWLMIWLPAVLLVVTALTALELGQLEPSISAYYGGPVRDVFVGVMIGLAGCMVAYQGASLLEDYTLNGAGFYAAFVALVPTNLEDTLSALKANKSPDGITADDYIWFLRYALSTVLVLCALLVWHELKKSKKVTEMWNIGPVHKFFVAGTSATLFVFLALAMGELWLPRPDEVTMDGFGFGRARLRVHDQAAVLLLAALAVAVWSHAWPTVVSTNAEPPRPKDVAVSRDYRWILGAMALGPVGALAIHTLFAPRHTVIFLEWWEIAVFAVFWMLETRRIGKSPQVSASIEAPVADPEVKAAMDGAQVADPKR